MNSPLTQPLSASGLPIFETDFFKQVLENISDALFVKDSEHRWIYMNQAFLDFVGFSREEMLGKSDYAFFPKEQADTFWRVDDQVFASGEMNVNVEDLTGANQRHFSISTRKTLLKTADGQVYLLGILTDITEDRQREIHHQQVGRILKHLVLGGDRDETLKIVLRVAEEALSGATATILSLDQDSQRLYPAVYSKLPQEFKQAIDGTPARAGMGSCGEAAFRKERFIVEDIATHPNWQRVRDVALRHNLRACWSQPVLNFAGDVVGTFALYFARPKSPTAFELEILTTLAQLTAITFEYHQIKTETEQLRTLLADMMNAMPSCLIAVDLQGKVLQWNAEAQALIGVTMTEAAGQPLASVLPLPAEQMMALLSAVAQQKPLKWNRLANSDLGENLWLNLTLYPIVRQGEGGSVIRIDDVTSQVRLEQMMVQTEKIHSLGGLTAGMAHEINNPLAGILQNIQVMKNRLEKGLKKNAEVAVECGGSIDFIEDYMAARKIDSLMSSVLEAGCRASNIVKNMLNFSRQEGTDICLNDLPDLMDKTLELLDNDYDQTQRYDFRNLHIEREYHADLPKILCGASTLQQVFFNLLKNAAQAMIDTASPTIRVKMQVRGDWFQVMISDNGPGMGAQVQRHIFEPFFTTKPVGTGTGLGLSVSYFIIADTHKGRMSVASELGQGTCFTLELPLDADAHQLLGV